MAFEEALKARKIGEVPIGSVIVRDNAVIGRGYNLVETRNDPTAHAEIIAIRDAARQNQSWRLAGASIYVTIEPCPMCVGAIHLARINQIVFGANDIRFGACGSYVDLTKLQSMTSPFDVVSGVNAESASELLKEFFREVRAKNKIAGP